MQHFRSLESVYLKNTWLTIGSFDGVHLGHQEIIKNLTAGARAAGASAVVLTFDPHPKTVLFPEKKFHLLTRSQDRAELLGRLGVDVIISYPFSAEVASLSARKFLEQLKVHLGFRELWVGEDFVMGRSREGNISKLLVLSQEMDYHLHIVPPITSDGDRISSSQIRGLLAEGEIEEANRLLGYTYTLRGDVIEGAKRGRTIGIPTANLAFPDYLVVPKSGVYVCQAKVDGKIWGAVANIGVRPTFEPEGMDLLVEAHLLDFSVDIYGKTLELGFLHRLRGEKRFPDIQALVEQIQSDIIQGRKFLGVEAS